MNELIETLGRIEKLVEQAVDDFLHRGFTVHVADDLPDGVTHVVARARAFDAGTGFEGRNGLQRHLQRLRRAGLLECIAQLALQQAARLAGQHPRLDRFFRLCIEEPLLHFRSQIALVRAQPDRSAPDSVCAERQRGRHLPATADTAGSEHRNVACCIDHLRPKNHRRNRARVSACLAALSDENIDARFDLSGYVIQTSNQRSNLDAFCVKLVDLVLGRRAQRIDRQLDVRVAQHDLEQYLGCFRGHVQAFEKLVEHTVAFSCWQRRDTRVVAELAQIPETGGLDFSNLPLLRQLMLRAMAQFQASAACTADVTTEDAATFGRDGAPPVSVRVFRPRSGDELLPAVLSIHGGGFMMGDLSSDDVLNGRIASQVGCVVVGVEYRLAPEHPYPAPLEDCYAALAWLFEHAARLGVDPARIGLRGMSAGGGLAAALALLVRDRGEFSLCFQMLDYPMLDDRHITQSSRNDTEPRVWNATANRFGWRSYLGELAGRPDMPPYAVPARAASLAGLPPACLFIGSADLFVDEVTEYACRLNAAGVMTELHVYPGGFHGFELMLPQTALARRFTADNLSALRRGLRAGTARQLPRHEST